MDYQVLKVLHNTTKVKVLYAIYTKLQSTIPRYKVHNPFDSHSQHMKRRLIVARHDTSFTTHETSFSLRRATCGMQNTMELDIHSCLIAPTHETSLTTRSNRRHPPTQINCRCYKKLHSKMSDNFSDTAEMSFTARGRPENDPSMIRP